MTTILITGANRGLGLELTRAYASRGDTVIACCRKPQSAVELSALAAAAQGRVRIEAVDVTDGASVARLARDLADTPIDILINNAGIYARRGLPEGAAEQTIDFMDYDMWRDVHAINVMAPFRVTTALLPSIRAGARKTVVMMSSDLGSIGTSNWGGSYAYRTSKAALNMLTKSLSNDLKADGVTVISMAPGWTRTDMGGADGHWAVEDSVARQQIVIDGLTDADTGRFINLLGEQVPW